eukprot:5944915-Amphidinium_carterae.1
MTKLFRKSRNMRFIIFSTDDGEASAVSASALARTGNARRRSFYATVNDDKSFVCRRLKERQKPKKV